MKKISAEFIEKLSDFAYLENNTAQDVIMATCIILKNCPGMSSEAALRYRSEEAAAWKAIATNSEKASGESDLILALLDTVLKDAMYSSMDKAVVCEVLARYWKVKDIDKSFEYWQRACSHWRDAANE